MLSDLGATPPARVLLVGDDPRAAMMLVEMLRDAWPTGLLVTQTGDIGDATHELADHGDGCVLLDLSGAGEDLGPLRALVAAAPDAAIVVISDRDDEGLGVAAVNAGAQDHLLRTELNPSLLMRALRYALERKRAEVRLTRQALEDPLTGLPNRALFLDRVGVALDRSRRTGLAPAVMFLDVDSFKAVNDSRGHAAGDRLLCTLSERFQALLRPMDTVARLGGDEFTFLFEGLSGRDEACAIARRVNEAASEPLRLGADETSVAVSIGVAMLDDPRAAPEEALSDADTAMYRAKSLGGGRAELFDAGPGALGAATAAAARPTPDPVAAEPAPGEPRASIGPMITAPAREPSPPASQVAPAPARRTALTAVADPDPEPTHPAAADALDADALRDGLADGQLRLHYQPRVSIDGRTGLVGFEALVRWEHPQRGLIVPAEFMGLAEDSGLIVEIGDWVLGEALSQVRRWRQSRPGMTISVNVSPAQLADPGLVGRLAQRLRAQHTDPSVLWLEVSEAALLGDRDHTAAVLGELAELGVGLAIDDFGRGPAGAEQLQTLPVEMLKIDRSVISHLDDGGPESELVEAVVALGHELGLSVVAEGVETDYQLASVRDLGCDGAQGYLFSRPVPEESVRELLGAR